jgi:outer membrane protein
MKKILSLLVLATLVLNASAADYKIGVIDLAKSFSEYYKTKEAEALLKERMAGFQKEATDMRADYQKLVDEINKLKDEAQDKTLNETARKEKGEALRIKVQDAGNMERKMQEFATTRQRQMEDQQGRMRKGIIDEITKVVNDMAAKEKYNFVFDKSGGSLNSGLPTLLFVNGVDDLTDKVISQINANKPAGSAASADPAKK